MTKQSELDIRDPTGCLGSIPSRAGMSILASQVAMKQVIAGAKTIIFDKGSSAESFANGLRSLEVEQAQRVMRIGRRRNDKPVSPVKTEPYYRQFDKQR